MAKVKIIIHTNDDEPKEGHYYIAKRMIDGLSGIEITSPINHNEDSVLRGKQTTTTFTINLKGDF